jgi:glycosyltransferase involved in cell wall biosynthesis
MKILMLGWELPPHNSGGLGVACYQLCKALSKRSVDIEFVLPYTAKHGVDFMQVHSAHPQDVTAVIKAGLAYDSFKYVKETGEIEWIDLFGQSALYEQAVERISLLGAYDVIHAHDWLTCRAAIRAKERTGLPLIVHMHSIEADRAGGHGKGNPLVREIESLALTLADRIVAVSEHTKQMIVREYGVPADKIDVVHNSFEQSDLIPQDGETAYTYLSSLRQQGYRIVASCGRLTMQKGLTNLLHAFKEVVERVPKSVLLVVGDGDQYHELVALSAQLGIAKNVVFTGFLRGKKWRDAFAIADLFVMPSISEPFGLVALEAIGYGTPILVSRQSGAAEVIANCLKVDFWDVAELANQMAAVLQNDCLRDELHANAWREYDRLSWDTAADKLTDLYERQMRRAVAA